MRFPNEKIDVIPHGVPDIHVHGSQLPSKTGSAPKGKSVLLTFGLLSPNKGIENVIRALARDFGKSIQMWFTSFLESTHPHIRRHEGERYREELQALAEQLGVSSNRNVSITVL
jgi:glycosyltransferase involved in cell wall biosynthesis